MSNRVTNVVAAILLAVMFVTAVFSIKHDSTTMDELAHLPAGYSYLTQKDMRLNPEHPPLIKDLSAIPLLFIKGLNFPSEIKEWKSDVNGQWGFGSYFLYEAGNPADKMIFWDRLPMILILILLGFYIFKAARELFGAQTALFSLFLFSFSPTFLAHGRLVTTDVGAAAGIFIATYYFLKTLSKPTRKNILLAGIFFGLAQLCKFSVILLGPFFVFLILIWWLIKSGKIMKTLKILILVFTIGFLLIGAVYQYHTWNYPPERQVQDTKILLPDYSDNFIKGSIKNSIVWAADKPILRPYAHYLTGLVMIFNRTAYGHTTYFLGEISNKGWKNYFPIVYAIKEPLSFHILTLIALLYLGWLIKRPCWLNAFQRIKNWIRTHFIEFAMLVFIAFYWGVSLKTDLNLGARHLLPIFPFTFILVSATIINWLHPVKCREAAISPKAKLFNRVEGPLWSRTKHTIVYGLIFLQIISVMAVFPHFLAYFNILARGPDNGYIYTVDSNLDWGQDLKRLTEWTEKNKIDKIYLDYFGGGKPEYYLKEKYAPWWGNRDSRDFPKNNYLAVSATPLQIGRGTAALEFDQPTGHYKWLDEYKLITKIGYSIFIYYID